MSELRETNINHIAGDTYATFYTEERKWINLIYRLKEQYPEEVEINHVNDDGPLIATIPSTWVKIRPKKKVSMTAEQVAASKARLEKGRLKRLAMLGDDVHDVAREME